MTTQVSALVVSDIRLKAPEAVVKLPAKLLTDPEIPMTPVETVVSTLSVRLTSLTNRASEPFAVATSPLTAIVAPLKRSDIVFLRVRSVPMIELVASPFLVLSVCSLLIAPFTFVVTVRVSVGVRLTMSPSLLLCSMLDVNVRFSRISVVPVEEVDVLETVSAPSTAFIIFVMFLLASPNLCRPAVTCRQSLVAVPKGRQVSRVTEKIVPRVAVSLVESLAISPNWSANRAHVLDVSQTVFKSKVDVRGFVRSVVVLEREINRFRSVSISVDVVLVVVLA